MKNKFLSPALAIGICGIFQFYQSNAQSFDALRQKFPDEKAVLLNKNLEYNINLKNGQPYVESHELEQIAYLLGSATTFMGEFGFSHSDFQKLVSYQAYTRTPDDKKLKVSEFKTSTNKESFVFYDDVKSTVFNFPGIEPGAVGNLEVAWQNTEPHLLSSFYFKSYLPVVNSELKIRVSNDIGIKYKLMGLDTANVLVKVENERRNKIYTFQYKNCPTDKSYGDAPGFEWYSPHVVFYIDKYKDDNGTSVSYLSNTDDLYKLNYSYVKTINNTLSPELKHLVDSLTANISSPELKAKNIYAWVQRNIKYVAFEDGMGGFVPRDAGLVCSRRFGDCKDMASILTQMLNSAGITAYYTWIGTRDLPYKFSEVPLPLVSNHMICTIKLDGKYIFLDGTDPTCVFGIPPYTIQDKEAMISISDKEYKILKVPVIEKTNNVLIDTTWLELTKEGLKGRVKQDLKGYFADDIYEKLMYTNGKDIKDRFKDEFERGSNKFKLDTFNIDRKKNNDAIALSALFTLPDYAKKIGTDYYLNLNLFKFFADEHIDYPKRTTPIKFDFKYIKKYVTLLKIPDGYKLSYLPQGKSFHNKVWGFDIQYEQKGGYIILKQQFDNDNLMLNSDQFADWNKVIENLLPLYKETLNLTKI